ncbi:hypothetical protein DLM45_00460 [Hyphomicrobium methylovorum]|uniref:hypothetical protein n=1 Tax=Hyphomicrobium methylovorum TaxID=84 RepID=UPI0015E65B14|nr:hypothetical protein [Hyphomicrobium methylovorum]MBA2124702.1 hypothetical protein [Hyphomicrobium methylovorum]
MRLGGWLLGLTGLVALGGILYLPSPPERVSKLAEVTRISIVPARQASTETQGVRTFSPASPLFRQVATLASDDTTPPTPPPAQAAGTWSTIVTPDRARPALQRGTRTSDAATRYELARDLQRELRRVGCYGGEITGTWTASTRRAMSAFMDRANASLPIDKPDYVLLSLVQNHDGIQCSAGCPSGQAMDAAGHCVPRAVVAQASKSWQRAQERKIEQPQRLASVEREQLPWLDANGQPITARPDVVRRADPLPGRMSVGGPVVERFAAVEPPLTTNGEAPRAIAVEPISAIDTALDADGTAEDLTPSEVVPERPHRARRAVNRDREYRPRHYASVGKTRRGQPRPGTMRFNLMQSLGGIY